MWVGPPTFIQAPLVWVGPPTFIQAPLVWVGPPTFIQAPLVWVGPPTFIQAPLVWVGPPTFIQAPLVFVLAYFDMVTVPHKMVGLERMLEHRGVGLQRFHISYSSLPLSLTLHPLHHPPLSPLTHTLSPSPLTFHPSITPHPLHHPPLSPLTHTLSPSPLTFQPSITPHPLHHPPLSPLTHTLSPSPSLHHPSHFIPRSPLTSTITLLSLSSSSRCSMGEWNEVNSYLHCIRGRVLVQCGRHHALHLHHQRATHRLHQTSHDEMRLG